MNCRLKTWNLSDQRVFLRVDLNIPLTQGTVQHDYRLQAIKPTLDFLRKNNAITIIATHIGRPTDAQANLSTQQLIPWFERNKYTIQFVPHLENAYEISKQAQSGAILLLENLRFYPGEKQYDPIFAQTLASLGNYYVNDAFALLHRNDTSITAVPALFAREKRSCGFLIEKELSYLKPLKDNPPHPFVVLLAGGKVKDKIPFLKRMAQKADVLLIGPAPVFTFVTDKPCGKSLVDKETIAQAQEVINIAAAHGTKILFPKDYLIAYDTFDGPLAVVDAQDFPDNGIGISIGPKTIQAWKPFIHNAALFFANGLMGTVHNRETLLPLKDLFQAITKQHISVLAGGDSVAAAQLLHLASLFSYLSTGGGATLSYIADQKLPGLHYLE